MLKIPMKRASQLSPAKETCEVRGTIERVRFSSASGGWSVLEVRTVEPALVIVVGHAPHAAARDRVRCEGEWITHPQFGKQFRATRILAAPPATCDAMEKYLASGAVEGVGAGYAKKLVSTFGTALPQVIEQNPVYLESVPGIGPERRRQIERSWRAGDASRDIQLFLHECGVGPARAREIQRRYKHESINVLRQNPYRLVRDISGIGFQTADEIAQRLGIEHEDPKRLAAGLRESLQQDLQQGHTAVEEKAIVERTVQLLGVDQTAVVQALNASTANNTLVREPQRSGQVLIFTPRMHKAESEVATHIHRLRKGALPWGSLSIADAIAAAERATGIRLSASQYTAVDTGLRNKFTIVTGGPGTGKTTITRVLLAALAGRVSAVELCAPLGRVAARLTDLTGRPAKTIHRLLMGGPGTREFVRNAAHPLDAQLLLVDEMSLVDVELMRALLCAVPDDCALIITGDENQLRSVGPGQVLNDLIRCGLIATTRLTEIHRQGDNSNISYNAHRINQGLPPHIDESREPDFEWIIERDPRAIPERITDLVCREFPSRYGFDPTRDTQILTPMRRGELGTVRLNALLQQRINPNPTHCVPWGEAQLGVGDRVMQQTNNYDIDVYNGDTGIVEHIDSSKKSLIVRFDAQSVPYRLKQWDQLALAYAMTVHKAQGSEFPAVIMPVVMEHYIMLRKSLLYTAIRGRQRVVLIGEEKAMAIALNSTRSEERLTGLTERLTRLAA